MVCIYCGDELAVVNSRAQKRNNSVWRRRKCMGCGSVFTTTESLSLELELRVVKSNSLYEPFSRDKLFVSITKALQPRKPALAEAHNLTQTIIGKILQSSSSPLVASSTIRKVTKETLKRFDKLAAQRYDNYRA